MRNPLTQAGRSAAACLIVSVSVVSPAFGQDHAEHAGGGALEGLGRVSFPVSCAPEVGPRFDRAVAMMHSFWLGEAIREFQEIQAADPGCGMAYWGEAISLMGNPMSRGAPSAQALARGIEAAQRAVELTRSAPHREQMYAEAALAYFADHANRDHFAGMEALERAFEALSLRHPEDMEATIFHARTIVANQPPDDQSYAHLLRGAAMMEPLFQEHPDHPGLAHYLIHAYDVPSLAIHARDAAFAYADIAPDAPHALHMPSHIFTRLGYWEESIETNRRSARAEPDSNRAVHPMDYMVYGYLQQGRDEEARQVVERALAHAPASGSYNLVAMSARLALERSAWMDAAHLEPPTGAAPHVEAITRFARAVGAARSGQPDLAEGEVAVLRDLVRTLEEAGDRYWAINVEAQRLAATAWLERARGNEEVALGLARAGADLEESVEKATVTPGPILPARELEGDLLLEMGRYTEAIAAYRKNMEREPRRRRSVHGAATAAERAGEDQVAAAYYRDLLELMDRARPDQPEVVAARAFLDGGP